MKIPKVDLGGAGQRPRRWGLKLPFLVHSTSHFACQGALAANLHSEWDGGLQLGYHGIKNHIQMQLYLKWSTYDQSTTDNQFSLMFYSQNSPKTVIFLPKTTKQNYLKNMINVNKYLLIRQTYFIYREQINKKWQSSFTLFINTWCSKSSAGYFIVLEKVLWQLSP